MDLIAPKQGENLHLWLLRSSRELLVKGHSKEDAASILLEATRNSGRTTQNIETEISNMLDGAAEFLVENPGFVSRAKGGNIIWTDPLSWVGLNDSMIRKDRRNVDLAVNHKLVDKITDNEYKHFDLWEENMVEEFNFPDLFSGVNFDLCAGKDKYSYIIRPLSEWQGKLERMQYIVPNYFWKGSSEGGDKSDFNIGERLFAVIEFDKVDKESQVSLLSYLDRTNKYFPLIMIVDSGNKSLHGWFACFGYGEYKVKTFYRKASELGADTHLYVPSQYVRMPEGKNSNTGNRQEVIFFSLGRLENQTEIVRRELL